MDASECETTGTVMGRTETAIAWKLPRSLGLAAATAHRQECLCH
jgi:hypothetical protein